MNRARISQACGACRAPRLNDHLANGRDRALRRLVERAIVDDRAEIGPGARVGKDDGIALVEQGEKVR